MTYVSDRVPATRPKSPTPVVLTIVWTSVEIDLLGKRPRKRKKKMNQVRLFQNMWNSYTVVVSDTQTKLVLATKVFDTKNEAVAYAVDYGYNGEGYGA